MNIDKAANAQNFQILKQIDRAYGEKTKKKVVGQSKHPKNAQSFRNMKVEDILAMQDD